ncbi:c-type cytochrome, methanol metabolism-related [Prosthecomicrobium sp. N25]
MVFLGAAALAAPLQAGPAVKVEEGKYQDKDGNPTWNKTEDGTWDWYTFSGYRRYHAECHVCHGPDGEGSTYAPALRESLKTMTYDQFQETVVNGRVVHTSGKESVMPAFGTNKNVMCYLDDIYVYLKARADGALPRTRPEKREPKLDSIKKYEDACISG